MKKSFPVKSLRVYSLEGYSGAFRLRNGALGICGACGCDMTYSSFGGHLLHLPRHAQTPKNGTLQLLFGLPIELFDRSGGSVCKVSHQPSYQSLVASATEGCKLCELLVDAIHSHFSGDVSPLTKEPQAEAFLLRSDIAGQYPLRCGRIAHSVP